MNLLNNYHNCKFERKKEIKNLCNIPKFNKKKLP